MRNASLRRVRIAEYLSSAMSPQWVVGPRSATAPFVPMRPADATRLAMVLGGRRYVEELVSAGIDLLDALDGDVDLEPCGDENDTGYGEDEFIAVVE